MKSAKIFAIVLLFYLGSIVLFESLLGFYQPENPGTLIISMTDEQGESSTRVVASLESEDQLYVAVNHWPRAWYRRVLANPEVQITLDRDSAAYLAVPVVGAEHERVNTEHKLDFMFRLLTGFPPRYFLRLDPR